MADLLHMPTNYVSLATAVGIVKCGLDDESLSIQARTLAIERVANMETHNSITKDELVRSLRWLFEHYEF